MGRVSAANLANVLLQLLAIGCGVAVVVIVSTQLWVTWEFDGFRGMWSTSGNTCFMAKPDVDINLCAYSFVAAGVGWVVSIVLLLAQCMTSTRGCKYAGYFCAIFGLLWWIGAAVTATVYASKADDAVFSVPREGYRTAVWALGWAEVGLFALTLLFSVCGAVGGGVQEAKQHGGAGYPAGACTQVPPPGAPVGAYTSNPTYVTEYPPAQYSPTQKV